jgi:ParB family transcriptional regulator, chromosome partitioning protein
VIPIVKRDVREIPIGLLDDPQIAMRDGFADEAFDELVKSIAANGIQIELVVVKRGDRYEVVAGHRRLAAARALHAVTVPCSIREIDDDELEFVKVLENEDRAPVNAADAAAYFMRLFTEKCGEDIDKVCARVRRERRYVEERILLFQGDEAVFVALKNGDISLGVAQELNKIVDRNYRLMELERAQKYGMTIKAAAEARKAANFATSGQAPAGANGSGAAAIDVTPSPAQNICYICHRSDRPERMRYALVHEHCDLAIGQRVLAAFREPDAQPGAADA